MSAIVWHDIECGRYREDLALWLELAARAGAGPEQAVLDVGSGTGRVSLPLAQAGYRVVALDRDPQLLGELGRRAGALPVQTVCADARQFSLDPQRFPLIIVPMQTVQLLGGDAAHQAFLRCARAHLRPQGRVAVAIADAADFEEFEWREGDAAPLPDIGEVGGRAYFSQPTAVRRVADTFVLERHREIVEADGRRSTSEDRIALDITTTADLQAAAERVGLRLVDLRQIAPTEEHIGSEVVIFAV